jgi:hypothetical protein
MCYLIRSPVYGPYRILARGSIRLCYSAAWHCLLSLPYHEGDESHADEDHEEGHEDGHEEEGDEEGHEGAEHEGDEDGHEDQDTRAQEHHARAGGSWA